ncbi:MAG TPA: GNAT family N-acetyltransferase [Hyphomicrobiaceae bacterium]|nr:GNAT family N-acetyltransferase [Hyphomicrobiaceae bacterium]
MSTVVDNKERERFEMTVEGGVAFVSYRRAPGVITLYHAEVPPELEGRGLGSQLAKATLDAIRAEGLKVVPRCSFIAAFMRRHPEYAAMRSA